MRGSDPIDRLLDTTLLGYTRVGHVVRRREWQPLPAGALAGKTVIVTGATSGIGRAAARRMAGLGAEVVVVGRNRERAAEVCAEIVAAGGSSSVELADLSAMGEIRELGVRLLDAHPSIHVLVNNAGVLLSERRATTEGLEATFATNLLGHFLLTNLLIPRLVESAPARIINVSSGGMYTQSICLDDLQMERDYDGRKAYARTKRGQVILTEMWAERLADSGVVVHALHPGWADTPGVASGIPLFRRLLGPLLRSAEQAADTVVWLAAAAEAAAKTGLFWHDRAVRPTHRLSSTRETATDRARFWAELETLSRDVGR